MNPLYVKLSLSVAITSLLSGAVFAEQSDNLKGWRTKKPTQQKVQTFHANSVASLQWGEGTNSVKLAKVPARNIAPQSFVLQEDGKLYLLDSSGTQISLREQGNIISNIQLSEGNGNDFCMLDQQVYLLNANDKYVARYNKTGEFQQVYPIVQSDFIPVNLECDSQLGIAVESSSGESYLVDEDNSIGKETKQDGTPLKFKGLLKNGKAIYLERYASGKGNVWIQDTISKEITEFPVTSSHGSIATLTLIDVDKQNNLYLSVEETVGEQVNRLLQKYSLTGELLAEVTLPYSLYANTFKDLSVTNDDEVAQIIPLRDSFEVVKWQLTPKGTVKAQSALEKNLFSSTDTKEGDFIFGELDSVQEKHTVSSLAIGSPISRQQILANAESYINLSFNVTKSNIINNGTIRTPITVAGAYTGVPYNWGGWNSTQDFLNGLKAGKYAGNNICTGGVKANTVGVDCSGYISRVWGTTGKYGTGTLPSISTQLSSKDKLKAGDILNTNGHVVLFVNKEVNGTYKVYESVGTYWKTKASIYTEAGLTNYYPYRYNNVTEFGVPKLTSPANSSVLKEQRATFQWTSVPSANQYRIVISQDPTFKGFKEAGGGSSCDATCFTTAGNQTSYTQTTFAKTDWTYYAKVRAANGAVVSDWSPVISFKTPIAAPVISSPSQGVTLPAPNATFNWNTIPTATSYRIVISQDSNFSGFTDEGNGGRCNSTCFTTNTGSKNSYFHSNFTNAGSTYYVKVRAASSSSVSPWSSAVSFKTPSPTKGLDLDGYCKKVRGASFKATVTNPSSAFSWVCASGSIKYGMDLDYACRLQHGSNYKAAYGSATNPYSWYCKTN